MGIFDKFKKDKKAEAPAQKPAEVKAEAKAEKKAEAQVAHGSLVLRSPHLSEKGAHFAATGRYVFIVERSANKPQIKKSIQKIYNVHVEDVKIINIPAKKRRYGQAQGETSPMKKAIVVLRSGEKIPGIMESVG